MTNLNFSLLPWQQQCLNDKTRFQVVVAGRRCGKSRYSIVKLLIKALQCPKGSAVMYVAPTQSQARMIIWDALLDMGREVIKSAHVNNMDITLVNDIKIHIRGADRPDTLRGVSLYFLVIDEAADVKPDVWEQVLAAALSDKKGDALFIGTPKGRNWFYDLYRKGLQGDGETISYHFTTRNNPTIDPEEIEAAKARLSSFAFKQEFLASFDNAGTDLFKEEWIKYGPEPRDGEYILTCDLAGFSDVEKAAKGKAKLDSHALALIKVLDNGDWWVKKIQHGRWGVKETAVEILKLIRDYRPIAVGIERGIARDAVMPYLEDLMRKNNIYRAVEMLTHGNKHKVDRIVWALQGRFEHGRITLNEDEDWDTFIDQLLMFPTTGVHDDLPDALAYGDQLAICAYSQGWEEDDWQPLDRVSGY